MRNWKVTWLTVTELLSRLYPKMRNWKQQYHPVRRRFHLCILKWGIESYTRRRMPEHLTRILKWGIERLLRIPDVTLVDVSYPKMRNWKSTSSYGIFRADTGILKWGIESLTISLQISSHVLFSILKWGIESPPDPSSPCSRRTWYPKMRNWKASILPKVIASRPQVS